MKLSRFNPSLLTFAFLVSGSPAERINHEGRILPNPVPVTTPTLFNTPEADAVVAAMQNYPRDNPWNEDISRRPVLPNSAAMIAQIIADLGPNRGTLRAFHEMNFVLVPDNQPLVPIDFFNWPEESDPSPYPIPPNMPVELWPRETGNLTLTQWQRDINDEGGDRHSIIVMPGTGMIWETWLTRLTDSGWEASNGAKFDLNSNQLRPFGWTSGDAAGFAMFPAIVRFDECERGMVEHALRIVVKRTRLGPIYPATHNASVGNLTDPNIPAMGQRVRLKADFVIPDSWHKHEKAVLRALKKYGAMVADNGNFFSFSVTPDDRFSGDSFDHISDISINNFEVIQTTGPEEGPRSPGAPQAFAGADKIVAPGTPVPLEGAIIYTNAAPALQASWSVYSGPGTVTFGDASQTDTTATFSIPGEYTLMLKAENGLHTPAYDTVRITVQEGIFLTWSRVGDILRLNWTGGSGPYRVEASANLAGDWEMVTETTTTQVEVDLLSGHRFFRIRAE